MRGRVRNPRGCLQRKRSMGVLAETAGGSSFLRGERVFRPFGFGPDCGGFDDGRWTYPGRAVTRDNVTYFLDVCVQKVMVAFQANYPKEFAGLTFRFSILMCSPHPDTARRLARRLRPETGCRDR